MKKSLIIIPILLILSCSLLFAVTEDTRSMTVTGFVSQIHTVSVSEDPGVMPINFDFDETGNLLITPTEVAKTAPGLKVATWSMISNCLPANLIISHGNLINTTTSEDIQYDYELAVQYKLTSTSDVITSYACTGETLEISLPKNETDDELQMYSIQDSGLYFRFSKINGSTSSANIANGQYTSSVTFNFTGV